MRLLEPGVYGIIKAKMPSIHNMSIITSQEAQLLQERLARNRAGGINRGKADPLKALPCAEQVAKESVLHGQILAHCQDLVWVPLHGSMAQATGRTVGELDFTIAADRGRVFFIEAKTKTGKPTVEQLAMMHWLTRLGHKPAIVRSFAEYLAVVSI